MKSDKDRWNRRFRDRALNPPSPPGFVIDKASSLLSGSVLDIASGDGAASLYLAEQGFSVTAADISDVALARLANFASDKQLNVSCVQVDFDEPELLEQLTVFDNLVMTHFKPSADLWPVLVDLLRPGGKLLLSTFNIQHHLKNGFSRRFCLEEKELVDISEELVLEYHDSTTRGEAEMDDYFFVRT